MANTGRKKMKPEEKKVNLCVSVSPDLYNSLVELSEDRVIGLSKLVTILLTTPNTVNQLGNGKVG